MLMCATRLVGQGLGNTCPKCGAELATDAMFCIVCGNPIAQNAAAPAPAPVNAMPVSQGTCTRCGAPLDADALFCIVCGAQVEARGAQPPAPMRSCPNCGWDLDPDALYCISCGAPVPKAAGPRAGVVAPGGSGTAHIDTGGEPAPNMVQPQAPGAPISSPGAPISLVPVAPSREDDDDATVRPRLVMLTREEARTGCIKTLAIDPGTTIDVVVPAGVDVTTKMDALGYGHFDEMTGQRGPLRLSFFID